MAKHVDYYLSLNSPWAYLASRRFEAIARKHGAEVTIWPVDFGAVFAVSGGLPLRGALRQAYRRMELKRWREHLGIELTLEPKFFPANESLAANCVVALREQGRMADAIKLAHAVLAALWAEEKNTGDPATLKEIIAGCGLDADAVIKAGQAPEMAAKREAYTRHAIEQSVFTMWAATDGINELVRRRSQPKTKPNGSTSTTCFNSIWAAAKANELTTKATREPQRPSSQP